MVQVNLEKTLTRMNWRPSRLLRGSPDESLQESQHLGAVAGGGVQRVAHLPPASIGLCTRTWRLSSSSCYSLMRTWWRRSARSPTSTGCGVMAATPTSPPRRCTSSSASWQGDGGATARRQAPPHHEGGGQRLLQDGGLCRQGEHEVQQVQQVCLHRSLLQFPPGQRERTTMLCRQCIFCIFFYVLIHFFLLKTTFYLYSF